MTVRLRGLTWDHPRGLDSVRAAAAEYAAATGVRIDWEARSLRSFGDDAPVAAAERYDLLVIDHPHVPVAAGAGLLVPLDGWGHDDELRVLAAQSVGPSHRSYRWAGRQWALACDAAAQVSAHRPDQLPDAPRCWDDVEQLAAEGRVRWALAPIDAWSSLLTLAAQRGTPPVARPGEFLDRQDLLAVLDVIHRLAALVPAEDLRCDPVAVAEILCGENRWCYSPLLFGYTNYSRPGFRPATLRYRDIPTTGGAPDGALLGGAGIAVSSRSEHRAECIAFACWLCSAPVQTGVYLAGGGQPGNAAAWSDPAADAATGRFFSGTRRTLEGAWVRPAVPGYLAFQGRASQWLADCLRGEITDGVLARRVEQAAAELLTGEAL